MMITEKPSDIDCTNHFFSTVWQNCEKETIAGNIVKISRWNGDKWFSFSWEDYKKMCKHSVTKAELSILNEFVNEGYLQMVDSGYSITPKFIIALEKYVKTDTAKEIK